MNFDTFNCFVSHFIIDSLIIQEVDLKQMIADIINVLFFVVAEMVQIIKIKNKYII